MNSQTINNKYKKEVKTINNQELLKINLEINNKNWKEEEKRGKNMAISSKQKLYSPVISRKRILKIKNSFTPRKQDKINRNKNEVLEILCQQ